MSIIEHTLSFTIFLGLIGLSIDGARWMQLQTSAQFAASSAAAAGAKQLNLQPGLDRQRECDRASRCLCQCAGRYELAGDYVLFHAIAAGDHSG
jgi:hypothetical protein